MFYDLLEYFEDFWRDLLEDFKDSLDFELFLMVINWSMRYFFWLIDYF